MAIDVEDYYQGQIALNGDTGDQLSDAEFQVYLPSDTTRSIPLIVRERVSGAIISPLRSNKNAGLVDFKVDGAPVQVVLRSGSYEAVLTSVFGPIRLAGLDPDTIAGFESAVAQAITAAASAQLAADAAQAAADEAAAGGSSIPQDDSVSTIKLKNTSVTTPKLADDSVTQAKMAPSSVGATEVIDASLTDSEVAPNAAIAQSKIAGLVAALAARVAIPSPLDPNADRILFWDDSAGAFAWLSLGANLTITGTTLAATGGGGGSSDLLFNPATGGWPTTGITPQANWKSTGYANAGRPPLMVDGHTWMFHPDDPQAYLP